MAKLEAWEDLAKTDWYKNASPKDREDFKNGYWEQYKKFYPKEDISDTGYKSFISYTNELDKNFTSDLSNEKNQESLLDQFAYGIVEHPLYKAVEEQIQPTLIDVNDLLPEALQSNRLKQIKESRLTGIDYTPPAPESSAGRFMRGAGSMGLDIPLMALGGGLALKPLSSSKILMNIAQKSPLLSKIITASLTGAGAMGLPGTIKGALEPAEGESRVESSIKQGAEGMALGAVSGPLTVGSEIVGALAKGPIKQKIISNLIDVPAQSLLFSGGDFDPENLGQSAAQIVAMKIVHVGSEKVRDKISRSKNISEKIESMPEDMKVKTGTEKLQQVGELIDSVPGSTAEKVDLLRKSIDKPEPMYTLKEQIESTKNTFVKDLSALTDIPETIIEKNLENREFKKYIKEYGKNDLNPAKFEMMDKDEMLSAVDKFLEIKGNEVDADIKLQKEKIDVLSEKGEKIDPALHKELADYAFEKRLYEQGREYISENMMDLNDPSIDFMSMEQDKLRDILNKARKEGEFPEDPKAIKQSLETMEKLGVTNMGQVVAKESVHGKWLSDAYASVNKHYEMISGEMVNDVRKSLESLPKGHDVYVRDYLRKSEKSFNKKMRIEKVSPNEISAIKEHGKKIREIYDTISDWAVNTGVSDYKHRENYFPVVIKERYLKTEAGKKEFFNAIMNHEGTVIEALKEKYGDNKFDLKKYTIEQRKEAVRDLIYKYSGEHERRYGHFMERKLRYIPEKFLETDTLGVSTEYINRATKRLVEIEHYGLRDENINRAMRGLVREIAENQNYSKEQASAIVQRAQRFSKLMTYKKSEAKDVSALVSNIMALQVMKKMPLSFISQYGQRFSAIVRGNVTSYLKAMKWRFSDKLESGKVKIFDGEKYVPFTSMDLFYMSGSAHAHITNDYVNRLTSEGNTFLVSGARKLLEITPFQKIDSYNRYVASTTGYFYAQDLMADINKVLKSDVAKKMSPEQQIKLVEKSLKGRFAQRRLAQADLDVRSIISKGRNPEGKYYLNKKEITTSMRKFEIDTNYRNDFASLPEIFQSDYGKLITQFQSYNYHRTKELRDFVLKEAMNKNFKPILNLAALTFTVGGGISLLRSIVALRDLPEDFQSYAWDCISTLGSIGWMNNLMSYQAYGTPPLGPTVDDLFRVGVAMTRSGKKKEDKWVPIFQELLRQTIPAYGNKIAKQFNSELEGGASKRSTRSAMRSTGRTSRR